MKHLVFIIVALGIAGCAAPKKNADGDKAAEKTEKVKDAEMPKKAETVKKSATGNSVVCELGKDRREIAVEKPGEGGCEVIYTKAGTPDAVANAKNDMSYCDSVMEKIKGKLESAGFKCN